MKIGARQLQMLKSVGTTSALVVPCPISRRLCEIGLMKSDEPDGSFAHVTPAGLRALADAAEAGRVDLFKMPEKKR
ncbi:hypothetical protein TAL182_CH03053 [Rhizobium sp. TAL182]|uniref:hypothetical protein n=1 Tax=Rhizobium sp. TAL182 TaxID=2020313 RepID=UPI000A2113A8|nr:hypothetical protein [Rhizobium sp. TAL182]ARO24798.1 hypothetical protein TAL182_CH03053 [Rhizobium sp. TAL182]